MASDAKERETTIQRKTVDGRTLEYSLSVAQEPMKARACGAGPRSAADRRPVDPPPIVDLHVYDVSNPDERKEITMGYDTSFLVHASLEASRPIAHGQRYNGPLSPVLTGVPVAGAAYLDRPKPGAYFIFSDLSVRHEGWFRLRFQLFEKTKHDGDADPVSALSTDQDLAKSGQPKAVMTNRMEVVSIPFQVYSAKKFPGLSESTDLSRIVAEQGCRVRIRRDVRQRRRNGKEDGDCQDDDQASFGDHSVPPTPIDRGQSVSRSDFDGSQAEQYRRQSVDTARGAFQPRPKMDVLPVPTQATYPSYPPRQDAAAAALIDMSQSGYAQASMPPPSSLPAPSAAFPPRPLYSTVPDPRAFPTTIVPAITSQRPERASQAVVYDAATRQYNLPQPEAKKRSISPRSDEVQERQRPRLNLTPVSRASVSSMPRASITSAANNASMDADDENDDSDSGLFDFTYKRADGSVHRKPVQQMMSIYPTPASW